MALGLTIRTTEVVDSDGHSRSPTRHRTSKSMCFNGILTPLQPGSSVQDEDEKAWIRRMRIIRHASTIIDMIQLYIMAITLDVQHETLLYYVYHSMNVTF